MRIDKRFKGKTNKIAAFIFVILLGFLISIRFDYYYDLNDDMLMKDIISGIFTGVPDGHNIQMLFPISWLLSLFYFLGRQTAWYALFFILCHFGCLYLIAERSFKYFDKVWSKTLALFVQGVFVCSFLLYELVFIQYTVTAALLGATAAFLLYTAEEELPWQEFYKKNVLCIFLVILAFQVRSEMLLLIFPLLCMVGIFKWSKEKKIICGESFKKYLSVIGTILIGMALSLMIHKIAYGSDEWKTFNSFFDSRTDIYDFYGIPPYEQNKEFYEGIGIQESEQVLLDNYNFGLSEHINEQTLKEIAEYAKQNPDNSRSLTQRLTESLYNYRYMLLNVKGTHPYSTPWNQLIIFLYAALLFIAICYKKNSFLWKLPMLFAVRSGLWLYLLYKGRSMGRVNNSLYLMEFIVMAVLLLDLYEDSKRLGQNKKRMKVLFGAVVFVFTAAAVINCPSVIENVTDNYIKRETINTRYWELQSYCKDNPDNFYFLDIYSTVAYSEKLFVNISNEMRNYDYLGGWASKSPLDQQKLEAYGIDSIEEAVLNQGNVFVVSASDRPITWLQQYLQDEGNNVTLEQTDVIIENGMEVFSIYQVSFGG